MASYLALLAAVAVAIPAALAGTCDECTTAHTSATTGSPTPSDTVKCAAAKTYAQCLLKATGTGCDTASATTKVAAITSAVAALTSVSCALTVTCSCQLAQYAASMATTDLKCVQAAEYTRCLFSQATTQLGCDAATANSVYRLTGRKLFTSYCGCNGSNTVSVSLGALLVVLVGMFFKN